jgi:MoxR-like ATPase
MVREGRLPSNSERLMTDETFPPRIEVSKLRQTVQQIKDEVHKIIVGQDDIIELMIAALLSEGHVLIEGVPGIAKTLTAKLIARTVNTSFSRIQFTPDLMPADVVGTTVFNAKTTDFEFKYGPIFANLILLDEINRAPAKTQSALFEVMEELQVTIDGLTYLLEKPFMVIATQNPIEQEGTYRLPEAQVDRFLFKIDMSYPTEAEEQQILLEHNDRKDPRDLDVVQPVVNVDMITAYQTLVRTVHVETPLLAYITKIVQHTRNHGALYLGASPRASLAILNSAKAIAAMRGRDFVTPEDIRFVTYPALTHRLMLTPEKEMEGLSPTDIIKQIIEQIEVPR